jgi:hypothetical protein
MQTDRTISRHGSTFHTVPGDKPEAFPALVRPFLDA